MKTDKKFDIDVANPQVNKKTDRDIEGDWESLYFVKGVRAN